MAANLSDHLKYFKQPLNKKAVPVQKGVSALEFKKLIASVEKYKMDQIAKKQKALEERQNQIQAFNQAEAHKFGYRHISILKKIDNEEITRLVESANKPISETNKIDVFDLGRCYAHGIGVKKSFALAIKCFEQVDEFGLGYAPASFNLALFYLMGKGVKAHPNNQTHAVQLLSKAASAGYIQCTY